MQNIELLFQFNKGKELYKDIERRLIFNKKNITFEYKLNIPDGLFCGNQICEILSVINYVSYKYRGQKIPIVLNCGTIEFYDKLVFVFLECICYYMLEVRRQKIVVIFRANHTIWSEGIVFSPLVAPDLSEFKKKFEGDLQGRHYRKIIAATAKNSGADLSELMQDIDLFLINNGVSEKNSEELAEVLAELVGNSREHAYSDTLIDIDLTETTYKKELDETNNYYGMNTAIINFSPILFYQPLKIKIESGVELPSNYEYVKLAYEHHKTYFNKEYEECDFYSISSFQDKISGSMKKKMGGRGLTTLVKSLEEQADTHLCYMLSGNTIIFLMKELLNFDDNNFVGFNKVSNYLSDIPDKKTIGKISTYLPGTSYNLSFVVRKEWSL